MNARARQTVAIIRAVTGKRNIRPRRRLPRQLPPKPLEREYGAAVQRQLGSLRAAFAPLLAALPGLLASAARDRRHDADEGKRIRDYVEQARRTLASAVDTTALERLAAQFFNRTAVYQRVQLQRQMYAALGADAILSDRKLPTLLDHFVSENVSLIKSIPSGVADKIEQATTRAVASGTRHEELAIELNKIFSFGEDRALLIARDQVGKAYGQINASRQADLGITQFRWMTSEDERVRPEHEAIDGQTFNYPEGAPGEGLPGEPVLCRCWAEPVMAIFAGLDEE